MITIRKHRVRQWPDWGTPTSIFHWFSLQTPTGQLPNSILVEQFLVEARWGSCFLLLLMEGKTKSTPTPINWNSVGSARFGQNKYNLFSSTFNLGGTNLLRLSLFSILFSFLRLSFYLSLSSLFRSSSLALTNWKPRKLDTELNIKNKKELSTCRSRAYYVSSGQKNKTRTTRIVISAGFGSCLQQNIFSFWNQLYF